MRNDDWEFFKRLRSDLRHHAAGELAAWFAGDRSTVRELRIGGMTSLLAALPYGRTDRFELLALRDEAHRINARAHIPCACGTRVRCTTGGLPVSLHPWTWVEMLDGSNVGDTGWAFDERLHQLQVGVGDRGLVNVEGYDEPRLVRVADREGHDTPPNPGFEFYPTRPEGFLLEVVADPVGLAAAAEDYGLSWG